MQFVKKGEIYKIIRITGNRDNILGIQFHTPNTSPNDMIGIIEWDFPKINKSKILTSKEEVLEQVLKGLKLVNDRFGTNYKISKIYFTPYENGADSVYSLLTIRLIEHYHAGKEFKET